MRGLLAHKLRLVLTSLSIALGVAFIAGTFVLTDSMNTSLTKSYQDRYAGVDAVVRSAATFEDSEAFDQRVPVSSGLLRDVQRAPGVGVAEGPLSGYALMTNKDGKAINPDAGQTRGQSAYVHKTLAGETTIASGRMPTAPDEVAIDNHTAKSSDFAVGDQIDISFSHGADRFKVVG